PADQLDRPGARHSAGIARRPIQQDDRQPARHYRRYGEGSIAPSVAQDRRGEPHSGGAVGTRARHRPRGRLSDVNDRGRVPTEAGRPPALLIAVPARPRNPSWTREGWTQ